MTRAPDKIMSDRESLILSRSLEIRVVEEGLVDAFKKGQIQGTVHTCIGQEYLASTLRDYLLPTDWIFSNHRGHGHFLAAGGNRIQLIAEILGKSEGVSGGIGGSQHLHFGRFLSNGIQGGLLPAAVGAGLRSRITGSNEVSVSFIGDGTLGQGQFWESLNIASTFKSRVLIICEDNGIAQSTPSKNVFCGDISTIVRGFGMNYLECDSRNLSQLFETVKTAFEDVRGAGKPTFLRVRSYRLGAHSKGDDNRSDEELQELKDSDPILLSLKIHEMKEKMESFRNQIRQEFDLVSHMSPSTHVPIDFAKKLVFNRDLENVSAEEYFFEYSKVEGSQIRLADKLYSTFADLFSKKDELIMLGEDIEYLARGTDKGYGGAFKITRNLSELHPGKLINMPISEASIVGTGLGAAICGRPVIVEIMFGDFLFQATDQIMQQISKIVSMYGRQVDIPMIVRTPMGAGFGYGATHSQSIEKVFLATPNLIVVAINIFVSTSYIYNQALQSKIPTLIIENKVDYRREVENPGNSFQHTKIFGGVYPEIELKNQMSLSDLIVVTYGGTLTSVKEVCAKLESELDIKITIFVYVLLSPLRVDALLHSIGALRKMVIVEEGIGEHGFGSELIAQLTELGLRDLVVKRVYTDGILPANKAGEWAQMPNKDKITKAIISVFE